MERGTAVITLRVVTGEQETTERESEGDDERCFGALELLWRVA